MPGGKKIQKIISADSTVATWLTLWEGEIGKLEAGKQNGTVVWQFHRRKFLSTSKVISDIIAIEDIGVIVEETDDDNSATNTTSTSYSLVRNVNVVGVMSLDKYSCCINWLRMPRKQILGTVQSAK